MYPSFAMRLGVPDAAKHVFNATRPGWPALVHPGDIMVGGRRFGLGSARPVALLLKELGITCILAEEFSSLFLRNSINLGLPVLAIRGVRHAFEEGDIADVDIPAARVRNITTRRELSGRPYPPLVLELIRHGGIENRLRAQRYLSR
jgi:3-isopropylmalate/(R)-2-methylmalate dehydratase small subunit